MIQYIIYSMHSYPYSHYKNKTLKEKIASDYTSTKIIKSQNKKSAIDSFKSENPDRHILKIIRVWKYQLPKSKSKFVE